MLHARLQGVKLGIFDIYFDSKAGEQIQAGQARAAKNGAVYYDIWTSFSIDPASLDPNGQAGRSPKESTATALHKAEPREEITLLRSADEADARPTQHV